MQGRSHRLKKRTMPSQKQLKTPHEALLSQPQGRPTLNRPVTLLEVISRSQSFPSVVTAPKFCSVTSPATPRGRACKGLVTFTD